MKSSLTCTMIAVAALAVAAGSASAQTLKAQIPMSFRVGAKAMTAGNYEVQVNTGNTATAIVKLYNVDNKSGVLTMPIAVKDVPKEWLKDGSPRLSFACVNGSCELAQLWNGEGQAAFGFYHRETNSIQARGTTTVTLAMVKAR